MKTIGNHIARFKNIYLLKLTKNKIHRVFTCLLTVFKSVSHGQLLPYRFHLHNFRLPLNDITRRVIKQMKRLPKKFFFLFSALVKIEK